MGEGRRNGRDEEEGESAAAARDFNPRVGPLIRTLLRGHDRTVGQIEFK